MFTHRASAFSLAIGALLLSCARADSEPTEALAAASISDASSRSPSPQDANTTAVERTAKEASDSPVGHLEHSARLASLFSRLHAIEQHEAETDVRILQFGDSHTASDYGTSVARARLSARFGDGGRGFIPMGEPYKRLFQAGEAMARGNGFDPDEASPPGKGGRQDGFFGPTGIAMEARRAGASLTSELSAGADRFEIAYLAQPGGGSFDVTLDGQRKAHVTTAQASHTSGFRAFEVPRGPHTLEVRALGNGAVRIFGVRLEDDKVGVTLDSLGVNGAKATTPLALDESHFAEQMARTAPSLAIFAYGTNEAGDATTTPDEHAAAIRALVLRVKEGAPGADCLVLGPPDRDARTSGGFRTLAKLKELIAAQRGAADEAGCAFYDQLAAMGGTESIGRWASESPPRARRDFVHLTRAGYAFLAEALVSDLVTAYESWDGERALALGTR